MHAFKLGCLLYKLQTDMMNDFTCWFQISLEILRLDQETQLQLLKIKFLYVAVLSYFLRLYISSGRNTRYVLQWSDKAVLLVLWTCGDVERNPGPANTKRLTRSEILRKFRRFTQMQLLEFIYNGSEMPKHPFRKPPPGWNDDKPEIEFKNISNTKSGEEEIFDKMLCLIEKKQIPLPHEWVDILRHYNNLKAKRNEEASKTAMEQWMLEEDILRFLPKITEYVGKTDSLHEKIYNLSKIIALKSSLSHGVSDRSCSCVENWREEGGFSPTNVPTISDTFDTNSEVSNSSTKKRPASNSVKAVADTQGISDTKKFRRNKDDPEKKRPASNSVKDVADTQGISDTEKFKRNKDDPEKCMSNQQQNLDMQGEYQSGSVYDTEGDPDTQPSLEVPTDGCMVQNANLSDAEDELLKKCVSNQQQSPDMHKEFIDDTAGPSDVQSSLEVPTNNKKLNLLHSSDDEDEELWKETDEIFGDVTLSVNDFYQVTMVPIFLRMYLEDEPYAHPSNEMVELCLQILNKVF
ncbi:uncharacterized protein LOC125654927 isoform X2 [Ostrea edulis]|uniref:uncharacterized protein LOC125654927 isoform X2 n=1 Tax=Ostrea edulis TaxID=37623 RepID=UPI0024AFC2AA|nr:uncharacterized protein LOC125654927 isoform X2 [Ostrea edulis]